MRLYPAVLMFLAVIMVCLGFCNASFGGGLEDVAMKPLNLGQIIAEGWLGLRRKVR